MIRRYHMPSGPNSTPEHEKDTLAIRAIASVLRHAQEGELPLFAWTLGLPQPILLTMVEQCFPELGRLEPMPRHEYDSIKHTVPPDFAELTDLLFIHRTPGQNDQLCGWLARAIAAAAFGSRHLWEDLGVPGREAVSSLMQCYFTSLHQRNVLDLKWKRFLFAELGARKGNPGMKPPECGKCDQFQICFQPG